MSTPTRTVFRGSNAELAGELEMLPKPESGCPRYCVEAGEAAVSIGGQSFRVRREFFDDIAMQPQRERIATSAPRYARDFKCVQAREHGNSCGQFIGCSAPCR